MNDSPRTAYRHQSTNLKLKTSSQTPSTKTIHFFCTAFAIAIRVALIGICDVGAVVAHDRIAAVGLDVAGEHVRSQRQRLIDAMPLFFSAQNIKQTTTTTHKSNLLVGLIESSQAVAIAVGSDWTDAFAIDRQAEIEAGVRFGAQTDLDGMRDERCIAGVSVARCDLDADELCARWLRAVVAAKRVLAAKLEHADNRVVATEQRDLLRVALADVDREACARHSRVSDAHRRQMKIVGAHALATLWLENRSCRATSNNIRHRAL